MTTFLFAATSSMPVLMTTFLFAATSSMPVLMTTFLFAATSSMPVLMTSPHRFDSAYQPVGFPFYLTVFDLYHHKPLCTSQVVGDGLLVV
jgi:hypothetical protein